jgi:uncharacterized membrane protein HdeD (DUF308 family)
MEQTNQPLVLLPLGNDYTSKLIGWALFIGGILLIADKFKTKAPAHNEYRGFLFPIILSLYAYYHYKSFA